MVVSSALTIAAFALLVEVALLMTGFYFLYFFSFDNFFGLCL